MKTKKLRSTELLYSITILFLLISIWTGLAPEWYKWYIVDDNGFWMKWLYKLLDGLYSVNIPISLVLIYVALCSYKRIWKDNIIRWYRFTIVLLGLFLLLYKSDVTYANIVWNIDYRMLLSSLLIFALLIMSLNANIKNSISGFIKYRNNILAKENKDKEEVKIKGFTCDNNTDITISNNTKKYISVLAEKLLATNIDEHSFAVGVTGEWGVGKTTFLDTLKEEIKNKADIVEFNPWLCRTPQQVTHDFFNSLREQLSPIYSILSNSIKEYAKLLNNITISSNQTFAIDMIIPAKEESLYEKKKNLSDKFAQLSRPVIVFIDDIDRLEREEVFEVLRLIRNTADMSNIIYVAAYDKEYVTCVLNEKNIKDAHSYLEKIFNVEVHLPKIEDYFIWEDLKAEINKQDCTEKNISQGLFKAFNIYDRELILNVLDNYRRTKRFARLYMFSVKYLLESSSWGEIGLKDLFWIELLQTYDKRTYDVLSNDPYVLLYLDEDRYRIKNGIITRTNQEKKNVFQEKPFWMEETPQILDKIFGNSIKKTKLSACLRENYEKYFTLNISKYKLSFKEMNTLFDEGAVPCDIVSKWINDGKYPSSIMYQMKQIELNKLEGDKLCAYLHGLLSFASKIAIYANSPIFEVKKLLRKNMYANHSQLHDIVLQWIDNETTNAQVVLQLSKLLNVLYVSKDRDEDGNLIDYNELVISNEEIEGRLKMLIDRFLENHLEFSALDILNEKSSLSYVFKNCCVTEQTSMDGFLYKQVGFDTIIFYFEQKESKPTEEMFDAELSRWSYEETPIFKNPEEENDYWNYMEHRYEQKMEEYFGSSCKEKLSEFKTKCLIRVHD